MSCDGPLQAYRAGFVNPKTGKRPFQFQLRGSHTGVRQMLPCGRCTGCKLDHAFQWGMRLMHESKMHSSSEFVTLTYRNEDLPHVGTLVPSHLQSFHKRLHNRLLDKRGKGIRYYGAGEYGDLNKRPHYHSILYGMSFPDKVKYQQNDRGEWIYTSKYLDELWGLGDCKIGDVTFESCLYVAKYCVKKVNGPKREAGHYEVYDADGVISERVPEFAHMSRRPGIGATYFAKYGQEIATHDSVIIKGREVPSIRFYDLRIEKSNPDRMVEIKRLRTDKRMVQSFDERVNPDRKKVKRILRDKQLQHKRRSL